MSDLFGNSPPPESAVKAERQPLPERLRPRALEDVVGQEHLTGPNGALTRMLAGGKLPSLILWGPPGTGKTTIARLLADRVNLHFVQISAVFSGVADLKKAFDQARQRARMGEGTLLFVDEIHRFNRSQQDGFLPYVEDGTVTLVGATTENPSFELNAALLSRTQVLVLNRLDETALGKLLDRAEEATGKPLPLTPEARAALVGMADGDGRFLLNSAEMLLGLPVDGPMDTAALSEVLARRLPVYDKDREGHYNLLSCFHKSLRGSDVNAAMYWAARMIAGGEEPTTIFRRLACAASEDVGMADPQAMVQVITAWQAFERVGWPEGRLFLAQAIAYVATAPKSNAAYTAFNEALALAKQTGSLAPPKHILNAPTRLMKELGYHEGYKYDHDFPDAFSGQEFFPEPLAGPNRPDFYRPNERGFERDIRKRLDYWEGLRRKRRSE
ncbi:replication-associated recombination protein A [Pedomonas sp. V897]|uniref:replication-associated recombination protein A n=1 Tax=Pedomonas sp. V897 TaxID=3446482 RepID=UPI003EE26736